IGQIKHCNHKSQYQPQHHHYFFKFLPEISIIFISINSIDTTCLQIKYDPPIYAGGEHDLLFTMSFQQLKREGHFNRGCCPYWYLPMSRDDFS
ncbi:MAG: hypothetical protein KKH76_01250, partial [Euryarchaeota archaeon]|nr:hypothetical protein [Euryarchaeota archaeon]